MIRFEKKPDPQPLPKDADDKRSAQIQAPAAEVKKPKTKAADGHSPVVAEDEDRLI